MKSRAAFVHPKDAKGPGAAAVGTVGQGTPGTLGEPVHPARPAMPQIVTPRDNGTGATGTTSGNFQQPPSDTGAGLGQVAVDQAETDK